MPVEATLPVTFSDVQDAAARLAGVAHRTPVFRSRRIDAMTGGCVYFKAENLQRAGAFKIRGAYNALCRLRDDQRAVGVLAYSSGNHAQGVALASALTAARATIIMPADAPRVKVEATREYLRGAALGSEVVIYDRRETTREALAERMLAERPMTLVSPYDNVDVIAGQGTATLELIEEAGPLDCLLVPCGGGGLLAGAAVAAAHASPGCRVIGVEPVAADKGGRSFRSGRLHSVYNPETIADGAKTPSLGEGTTFPIIRALVHEMRTAPDAALVESLRLVAQALKLVIEPTAGLAVAELLRLAGEAERPLAGLRIGVVLSGGNVEIDRYGRLLAGGQ